MAGMFALVLCNWVRIPSEPLSYALFVYSGLLFWQILGRGLGEGGASLSRNAPLITKVRIPKIALPAASIASALVDFCIALIPLAIFMLLTRQAPGPALLVFPLFALLAAATALGCALWASVLQIRYRDVGYLIPFAIQFAMIATPVFYPLRGVPDPWRTLLALNPMAAIVEGARWSLSIAPGPPLTSVLASCAAGSLILVSGLIYFTRAERTMADYL
jgi:lipopolysaccharide transport system permease protein